MTQRSPRIGARRQRGLTFLGLAFWGACLALVVYVGLGVIPTVNEFFTIQRVVKKLALEAPATVQEVRAAFDRQRQVEFAITSLTGADLEISKEDGKVVIAFAYEKEVPIAGPVSLLIKYNGRSK